MANSTSHDPHPEPTPGSATPSPTGAIERHLVQCAETSAAYGHLAEAARQLDAALVLDPENPRAVELAAAVREARISKRLGEAAHRILQGDPAAGRAILGEVLEIAPCHREATRMLELSEAARTRDRSGTTTASTRGRDPRSPRRGGRAVRAGVGALLLSGLALGFATFFDADDPERAQPPRASVESDRAARLRAEIGQREREVPAESAAEFPTRFPAEFPAEPPLKAPTDTKARPANEPTSALATVETEGEAVRALVATARSLLPLDDERALAKAVAASEAAPGSALVAELESEIVSRARERAAVARRDAVSFGANERETRYFRDADELFVLGDFRTEDSFAVAARSYWVAADLFARSRREALVAGVHRTIEAYETAHEAVDIAQLQRVWPNLDGARLRSIEEEFRRARRIAMRVDDCSVELRGERATATCHVERTERRRFGREHSVAATTALDLSWSGERWVIDRVADAGT